MNSIWIKTDDLTDENDMAYPNCRPLVLFHPHVVNPDRYTEYVRADSIDRTPTANVIIDGLVMVHGVAMTIEQIEALIQPPPKNVASIAGHFVTGLMEAGPRTFYPSRTCDHCHEVQNPPTGIWACIACGKQHANAL